MSALSYLREIEDVLHAHGAVLVRRKTHPVYRFPDGRIWVVSGSPRSDSAWKTNLHDLKKLLGISVAAKTNPQRRRKPGVGRRIDFSPTPERKEYLEKFMAAVDVGRGRVSINPPSRVTPYAIRRTLETTPLKWILYRLLQF